MADVRYIYWDANPFCAIFNNEAGRVDKCREILKSAERGDIKIVTSSITLTEVVKIKGGTPISPGKETVLYEFFQNDYILFVNVEWFIGTNARRLIHQHSSLKPMDAIHLATAIKGKVAEMHTYDGGLIGMSKKVGVPPLAICEPSLANPELPI